VRPAAIVASDHLQPQPARSAYACWLQSPSRVRAFSLLTARRGHDLDAWMTAVETDDLPALHAFVHGLRKDLPAVVAGLTLPYSNGPIEGANTKVKLLKRQMYGRAGFALLRQRILLS
jgi:transposase